MFRCYMKEEEISREEEKKGVNCQAIRAFRNKIVFI
jgi:hypothetical protein